MAVAAAAAAGLMAWAVHGLLDYFYEFLPLSFLYWTILGLAASGAVHGPAEPMADVAGSLSADA